MKLIIGLGNPGLKYENTRHNAGFKVMDKIAELMETEFQKEKFSALIAKTKFRGEDVLLMKPLTYMNLSGIALRQAMDFFKLSPEDILLIYDDVDLPTGKIRLRQKGSAGGHNGVKSVIQSIFTSDFNRIRVGVGKDPQYEMADWVLSKFKPEEQEDLSAAVEQAAKAAVFSVTRPFEQTMNRYNKK